VDPSKVIAVVETHKGDRDNVFAVPDENSNKIASYIIDFLSHEMKMGRLPKEMLPIQSGVGNVANAVLAGLLHGPFENLLGFTEVLQDGMLDLLRAGKMSKASATSISLAPPPARTSRTTSTSTASASSCARRRSRTTPSWCAAWASSP
jgi:succinyl-CoA:acetate CoA-transferase